MISKIGAEWDAGVTPPGFGGQAGRWTVRREANRIIVYFYCFKERRENLLAEFPPTEQGERAARAFARRVCDNLQTTRMP
jgi:hypothetical protein